MFRSLRGVHARAALAALLAVGVAGAHAQASRQVAQDAPRYGFGRAPTAQELDAWDIDVRPDGHGVRKGKGNARDGQEIYDAKCASCHGTFGESNNYMVIAGGVTQQDLKTGRAASLKRGEVRTVGNKLNYATTLYDYIHRAMPWNAPQSLSVDETYAVTAYVLHLNEIVPEDFELSDQNILKIPMPNRNGMSLNHGMLTPSGKPDVQGTLCMKDCIKGDIKITSELPVHARNAHGNLAEQKRELGPYRGIDTTRYDPNAKPAVQKVAATAKDTPATAAVNPRALADRNGCLACHGVANRVVGPGFNEVAAKYAGRTDGDTYLARKIKEGGVGVWGQVPMPPQAVKDDESRALASWILNGAR